MPPIACLTFTEDVEADPDIIYHSDPALYRTLVDILNRESTTANGAYDLAVYAAKFPDLLALVFESLEKGLVHDVLLRQKLMDIGEGCYRMQEVDEGGDEPVFKSVRYGLTDLSFRYFGEYLEKDEYRLQYGKLRHLPLSKWPAGAIHYAKNDARVTLKTHIAQDNAKLRAPTPMYLVNESAQCQASFVLQLIAAWGFKTDEVEVRKFLKKIEIEQEERREVLQAAGLVKDDESRTQKAAIAMMREIMRDNCELTPKGLELYRGWWSQMAKLKKLTDEGKIKEKRRLFDMGYVSLKGACCLESGNDTLIKFGKYGQFKTLYSKVSKLITNGKPVQTSFETLLASGRTSSFSSRLLPNSVAIQNLPRAEGMRECFVARPGKVLLARDFSMAELVAIAQICFTRFGYSKLREALNAGNDPHLGFASRLLGISYAEALANKETEQVSEKRGMSKPFNFGRWGGLGAEKFMTYAKTSYGIIFHPDPNEALGIVKAYNKQWDQQWPESVDYFAFISALCEKDPKGLCDIRQFKSNRLRGRLRYTEASNGFMQSLTGDAFKAVMFEVSKRCYVVPSSALYGSRIVAPVHDEIVLETDEETAHEADQELKFAMESVYQSWTPDVLIKTEGVMSRRWRKKAKAVYDHNGRLVPWEDRDLYKKVA